VSPGGTCCNLNVSGKVAYPVGPETKCEAELTVECTNPRYAITTLCGEGSTCCDGVCVAPGGECCHNFEGNPFVCGAGGACCGDACMDTGSHCCEAQNNYSFPVSLLTPCEEATPPVPLRSVSSEHKHNSLIEAKHKQETTENCSPGFTLCGGFCMPDASDCCEGLSGVHYQCAPITGGNACCGGGCVTPGGSCCNLNVSGTVAYPVAPGTGCEAQLTVECENPNYAIKTLCAEGSTCCDGLCVAPGGVCCENDEGNPFVCGAGGTCCGNACMDQGSQCCVAPNGYEYPVSLLTTCEVAPVPDFRSVSSGHRRSALIQKEEPKVEKPHALGIVYPADDKPLQSVGDIIARGWANACPSHGSILHCPLGLVCCHGTCISQFSICCENVPGNGFGCGIHSTCCGNACAGAGSKCCEHPDNPNADYPVTIATQCRGDIGPPVSCPANGTGGVPFSCGAGSSCCGTICAGEGSECFRNTGGNYFVCSPGSTQCGDACAAPGNSCCSFGNTHWPVVNAQSCPQGSLTLFTV